MFNSEFYFSIYDGTIYGELSKVKIIVFCPINYWIENKCLPDYYFSDQIDDKCRPSEYRWFVFCEECAWMVDKAKSNHDIILDLTKLGFVYNLDLEKFLIDCYR